VAIFNKKVQIFFFCRNKGYLKITPKPEKHHAAGQWFFMTVPDRYNFTTKSGLKQTGMRSFANNRKHADTPFAVSSKKGCQRVLVLLPPTLFRKIRGRALMTGDHLGMGIHFLTPAS
jgi:hypothetical protein